MSGPPPYEPLYLSEYLQYWQERYKEALALHQSSKECEPEALEALEATAERHLCYHFDRLRGIVDDDYFEWNQAMCPFLALCQWRDLAGKSSPHMPDFCRQWVLLEPRADRLSEAVLLLKHVDDRWPSWQLKDFDQVRVYLRCVHREIAKFVVRAGGLQFMDRWNLLEPVRKGLFRLHPKGIFRLCAQASLQLRTLELGRILRARARPMPVEIEPADREHFKAWAERQDTYYHIRTFRQRLSNFMWLFLHDEASRCEHTYERAGEVPTVYASVTAKWPSGWIGNLSHEALYAEPLQLHRSDNALVAEANLLALFEAVVKTLYSFEFIKYCFCNEHAVVDMKRQLFRAEHPVLVRAWAKWGIVHRGEYYEAKGLTDALLLWVRIVKERHQCILMKSFNLTNLVNQITRVNKAASLGKQTHSSEGSRKLYEVCL